MGGTTRNDPGAGFSAQEFCLASAVFRASDLVLGLVIPTRPGFASKPEYKPKSAGELHRDRGSGRRVAVSATIVPYCFACHVAQFRSKCDPLFARLSGCFLRPTRSGSTWTASPGTFSCGPHQVQPDARACGLQRAGPGQVRQVPPRGELRTGGMRRLAGKGILGPRGAFGATRFRGVVRGRFSRPRRRRLDPWQ